VIFLHGNAQNITRPLQAGKSFSVVAAAMARMVAAIAPGTEPLAWWRRKQIFAQ
jgi:hypothetical protein